MRLEKCRKLLQILSLCFCLAMVGNVAKAENIHSSPYVEFSPDGQAWTTNAGDTDFEWYSTQTKVVSGIESTLEELETGQHYYKELKYGTIPVGEWKVSHRAGSCIHDDYPSENGWHNIAYGRSICRKYYYSGWNPYCADCGERIVNMLFYMSKEAAESIDYIEAGVGMDYYYLCPWCENLEMGSEVPAHACNSISWNRYKVRYDANTIGIYGGYMEDSIHFYNNVTLYEGEEVTPLKRLNQNTYFRTGYEFVGWNTKADGSGDFYEDGAEIFNLTDENYASGSDSGIVTLYAMWRPCAGTLYIDPMGGTYEGKETASIIEGKYLESYTLKEPVAPRGYTLQFDTCGGNKIAPITGTMYFLEWKQGDDFGGIYKDGVYLFKVSDGNRDTLEALYEKDPIILPLPQKEGYSFGGWYYDKAYKSPAGDAGDKIIPDMDRTLYAEWVDLKLTTTNNYKDNDGKGAVDLSWSQPDDRDKNYLIYQSRDQENWEPVTGVDEIGAITEVDWSESYSGNSVKYTVPYTGIYQFFLSGAQGGNYGAYQGGAGGTVNAEAWLEEGEELTLTVGGQNGYYGGGIGNAYGNGGGYTAVSSDKKGLFLVAGGGGGASASGDGEDGGSSNNLTTTMLGEDGMAGGGGGYKGGKAGEYIVHYHTEECYLELNTDVTDEYGHYRFTDEIVYDEEEDGDDVTELCYQITQYGSIEKLIPVMPGDTLELEILHAMLYSYGDNNENNSFIEVYNQNGERIYCRYGGSNSDFYVYRSVNYKWSHKDDEDESSYYTTDIWWEAGRMGEESPTYWEHFGEEDEGHPLLASSGNIPSYIDLEGSDDREAVAKWLGGTTHYVDGNVFWGECGTYFIEGLSIPEGTTGIYLRSSLDSNYDAHDTRKNEFCVAMLSTKKLVCGYEEGQIISSKPAYGGSNYADETYCMNHSMQVGANLGDGSIFVVSKQIGFRQENHLDGVRANDLVAPDAISEETIRISLSEDNQVHIKWQMPDDNGTEYFHFVESYQASGNCKSNITKNLLTTGVRGYYWVNDTSADTKVRISSADFSGEEEIVVPLPEAADTGEASVGESAEEEKTWLHIAPVDVAGNIGDTIHINLDPTYWKAQWKIYTEALWMESSENVYAAEAGEKFFVKCDGETPFVMDYSAWMDGTVYEDYKMNLAVFESSINGGTDEVSDTGGNPLKVLNTVDLKEPDAVTFKVDGEAFLHFGSYTDVERSQEDKKLHITQQFTLEPKAHGQSIEVIPRVGIATADETIYSEYALDKENGLILVGDGEAPIIYGMEALENLLVADRSKDGLRVEVKVEDNLSGVADFYLEIANQDNKITKVITADENGIILVDLSDDEPVFSGDFSIKAYAVDNVGNEREISCATTGFSLKAEIKRILPPHDPLFRRGESGILTISVWGYPDRVEVAFPEEMLQWNPDLNQVFDYTDEPQYEREENLQFMIPIDMQEGEEFQVTVRAYKGDRQLTEYPSIAVLNIEGSVLDNIRTRLR